MHALIKHYLITGRMYALIKKYALNKHVCLLTRLYGIPIMNLVLSLNHLVSTAAVFLFVFF